jgi:hypothetical protein
MLVARVDVFRRSADAGLAEPGEDGLNHPSALRGQGQPIQYPLWQIAEMGRL